MGEVASLNRARKARTKLAAQGQAVTNRAKFGRDKAAKALDRATRTQAELRLDDAKREP